MNLAEVHVPPPPVGMTQPEPPRVDVAELGGEPPEFVTGANRLIAERGGGVDQAGLLAAGLQRQVSDPAATDRAAANLVDMDAFTREHGLPPLPYLSAEGLGRFGGGAVSVPVRAEDTPQMVALRQLQMTAAAVGRDGRLTTAEQQAFVERWRGAAGEGLYHYEADGTRRPMTAEEFGALQREGRTVLELRGEWQPRMVEDLRRMLSESEPVSVTTTAPRMTETERVAAGRREAEQQLGDFYRIQANAGIGVVNGTLQVLSMQPEHLPGVRTEDGQAVANPNVPQLPYLELQSEYFRGGRGEVLQTAATIGAGVIMGGGAAGVRQPQGLNLSRATETVAQGADDAARTLSTGARELRFDDFDSAERIYEAIRQTSGDVALIARNTGMREAQIQRIKDHLFYHTHQLDDGVRRFDADPEIANAWRRIEAGSHTQGDIQLLNHELFESRFEGISRTDYRTAHGAANRAGRPSGLE